MRAKFTPAAVNEEGKEQSLLAPIVYDKEVQVHECQAKLISCPFSFEPKFLCLSTFLQNASLLWPFLDIIDSRQLRRISQTLLKHAWPRHEIAITFPIECS